MVKNTEIIKLFKKIRNLNLFTTSPVNEKVYTQLQQNPDGEDGAQFIATTGEPTGEKECSECRKILPESEFDYYQARVKSDGSLMRSNALCRNCRRKLDDVRDEDLEEDREKIPPKPAKGDTCLKCGRAWEGNWHRDHDYETGKFRRWLCGQCNMSQQDRRTPKPKP